MKQPHFLLCVSTVGVLVFGPGCSSVRSSAIATSAPLSPYLSGVTLSATHDPPNAEQVGIVEAHGQRGPGTLSAVALEFTSRVAKLGADYGRIDSFATKFETVSQSYLYDCGTTVTLGVSTDGVPITSYLPMTCTGYTEAEIGTLTLTGRAFRTQPATPKP